MSKKYYTLATREGTTWGPQFGDYDRAVVREELDDMVYNGSVKRMDATILCTGPRQDDINNAIAELNAPRH